MKWYKFGNNELRRVDVPTTLKLESKTSLDLFRDVGPVWWPYTEKEKWFCFSIVRLQLYKKPKNKAMGFFNHVDVL